MRTDPPLSPRRAVILAAGLGTRLRPLTCATPKPLLPLWGVPLLEHLIRLLESWGVEEILVNLHWQADKLERFLQRRTGGARLRALREEEILGTGGALRPMRPYLGEEPFWLINGDIAAQLDPAALLQAFAASGHFAAAWLEPHRGPRTVEMDHAKRITCYRSPTPGVAHTYTFCGLQLLGPDIFTYLPQRPFSSIIEAYEAAMFAGSFLRGAIIKGSRWDDAGTIESYLRLHTAAEARKWRQQAAMEARPPRQATIWTDAATTLPPDVRGGNSVVERATLLPGTTVWNSIIKGGTLGGRFRDLICVSASESGEASLAASVAALGWPVDETAATPLGARGSQRSFWRLYHREHSAIFIQYDPQRAENCHYAARARFLKEAGIPVPRVLAELPQQHTLILEDWGDDSLEKRMRKAGSAEQLYPPALKALAGLHTKGTTLAATTRLQLEPPFDAALYDWEHDLCLHHLLRQRYQIAQWPEAVLAELRLVVQKLLAAPRVLLHRDYQSSNILLRAQRPALIDFQGMRLGAAAYDLASLLYDPYVQIPQTLRLHLAETYAAGQPELLPGVALLHYGAVQRLIQALGAFGRLAAAGQPHFTRHILPALENLLTAADECDLDALGGFAEDLIAQEERLLRYRPPPAQETSCI